MRAGIAARSFWCAAPFVTTVWVVRAEFVSAGAAVAAVAAPLSARGGHPCGGAPLKQLRAELAARLAGFRAFLHDKSLAITRAAAPLGAGAEGWHRLSWAPPGSYQPAEGRVAYEAGRLRRFLRLLDAMLAGALEQAVHAAAAQLCALTEGGASDDGITALFVLAVEVVPRDMGGVALRPGTDKLHTLLLGAFDGLFEATKGVQRFEALAARLARPVATAAAASEFAAFAARVPASVACLAAGRAALAQRAFAQLEAGQCILSRGEDGAAAFHMLRL